MSYRILVVGLGMLGYPLAEYLSSVGFTVAGLTRTRREYHDGANYEVFVGDVTVASSIFPIISSFNPAIVVHTAALTDVDYCEINPRLAYRINALGARNVAIASKKSGAKLIYFSTDYVFDGRRGHYSEGDLQQPINVYGRSKLMGERLLLREMREDVSVLRLSTPYHLPSPRKNFLKWILDKLAGGEVINAVTDMYSTPTCGIELFKVVGRLVDAWASGIFHVGGGDRLSRFEFAELVADVFGFDKTLISPVKSSTLDWVARRPHDSSLVSNKVVKFLNVRLDPVKSRLEDYAEVYWNAI